MIIEVTVVPNSPKFSVGCKNGRLKVALTSEPERNKANIELIQGLSKLLGKQVRIISGLTSKRKKLAVDLGEGEWKAFLAGIE
ncbi:DUF167 domain-containing protein [Candidatus Micrarchaeota archaeon]|nr:DUF167 domain-containing protein [Candidatus Micrarchaeota archaeon]